MPTGFWELLPEASQGEGRAGGRPGPCTHRGVRARAGEPTRVPLGTTTCPGRGAGRGPGARVWGRGTGGERDGPEVGAQGARWRVNCFLGQLSDSRLPESRGPQAHGTPRHSRAVARAGGAASQQVLKEVDGLGPLGIAPQTAASQQWPQRVPGSSVNGSWGGGPPSPPIPTNVLSKHPSDPPCLPALVFTKPARAS